MVSGDIYLLVANGITLFLNHQSPICNICFIYNILVYNNRNITLVSMSLLQSSGKKKRNENMKFVYVYFKTVRLKNSFLTIYILEKRKETISIVLFIKMFYTISLNVAFA